MKNEQFDALAQLLRLRPGPAQEGARLVLVEGLPQSVAADRVGASPQSINNCVKSCKRGISLAAQVVGI